MLNEIISKQVSSLQVLDLKRNSFSKVHFAKVMTRIVECGVCSTLKELILWSSTNFEAEESM